MHILDISILVVLKRRIQTIYITIVKFTTYSSITVHGVLC